MEQTNRTICITQSESSISYEMIKQLRENFHSVNVSHEEQLRILRLLPSKWNIDRVARVMKTTRYKVQKARKAGRNKAIPSKPKKSPSLLIILKISKYWIISSV